MNKIKIFGFMLLLAAVGLMAGCKKQPTPTATKPVLTADIPEILANGTEKATFTVTYNGVDVTSQATITNTATGEALTGNTFSTTTPGTYTFAASYNNETSETVTIEALPTSDLLLAVDKPSIINNGEDVATFTVTYQGNDVTAQAVIVNMTSADRWDAGVNTFSSQSSGTYEFRASYDGKSSNSVTVTVTIEPQNPLTLHASTPRINANGADEVVFTVLYDGEDVTSQATITNTTSAETVTGNTFSSSVAALYQFEASYQASPADPTIVSDAITVACGDYDFYKNVLLFRFTGAWCQPCGQFSSTLKAALDAYPDRVIQMAIHTNAGGTDNLTSSQLGLFLLYFSHNSWPTLFFDFDRTVTGKGISPVNMSTQEVVSTIQGYQAKGAQAGIAMTSTMEGRTANVTVRVTPSQSGTYYLGVAVVEDGLAGTQNGVEGTYINNDTFRILDTEVTGNELGSLTANTEVSQQFSFDLSKYTDNCRIVAYVNMSDGNGGYTTTNAASCPINGSIDYRFEE